MSIRLERLTKSFGGVPVLNSVSLEIQDGELFVLLGGSGSGKSTVLRLVAGLTQPDAGRIELNGRDVTHLPPQVRGTGFVFQNYSIFRHMTVAENVGFGLRIRRAPAAEQRRRSEELLELVGLSGLGARYADQLSGGQQQRVALARALAYEPAVLLLDEPFGALDVRIRQLLRKSLKDIQRQLKVTTILVTHDQEEAFELADRVGVIERGHLIETGPPEALYHRPRTETVAIFVGGGNVLAGREEGGQIRLGEIRLPLPAGAATPEAGAPVRVLFRPETVRLQAEPFAPDDGLTALGRCQVVEHIFNGPLERIVLEVDSLRGARPLAPPAAYGQRAPRIEARLPSQAGAASQMDVGQFLWAGLQGYHVLAPTGLKVLIGVTGSAFDASAVELGGRLAQAAAGPTTLLGVAATSEAAEAVQATLAGLRASWLAGVARLEVRVRQGSPAGEVAAEAGESLSDLVVLGRPAEADGLGAIARHLLAQAEVPVLLVQAARPQIARILICTAGGEPGKSDVGFGGRLARRTGARVTVLNAHRLPLAAGQRARLQAHLQRAQASLEALNVPSEIKLEQGAEVEAMLREAEAGDYDLIVIGAPAPRVPQQWRWRDFAAQIVSGTSRPVLVVPMRE